MVSEGTNSDAEWLQTYPELASESRRAMENMMAKKITAKKITAKKITDSDLKVALGLTDEDIQTMRELEGDWDPKMGFVPRPNVPLVEVLRLIIGNSIVLSD
jgi:hypothetical protein